jgi:hypothetical protein
MTLDVVDQGDNNEGASGQCQVPAFLTISNTGTCSEHHHSVLISLPQLSNSENGQCFDLLFDPFLRFKCLVYLVLDTPRRRGVSPNYRCEA